MQSFLEYMLNSDSITKEQADTISQSLGNITKDTLYYYVVYGMMVEDIDHIWKVIRGNNNERSFEAVAIELDLLSLDIDDKEEQELTYKYARRMADLEYISEDSLYTKIMDYKMDCFFSENLISMDDSKENVDFFDEYLKVYAEKSSNIMNMDIIVGEPESLTSMECEFIICQELVGETEAQSILTALLIPYSNAQALGRNFYKQMNLELIENVSKTNGGKVISHEAVVDACCEFLNNTNGICTYKFETGYDLNLPYCMENTRIYASDIRRVKFETIFGEYYVCVITSGDCTFERMV